MNTKKIAKIKKLQDALASLTMQAQDVADLCSDKLESLEFARVSEIAEDLEHLTRSLEAIVGIEE